MGRSGEQYRTRNVCLGQKAEVGHCKEGTHGKAQERKGKDRSRPNNPQRQREHEDKTSKYE